MKISVIVPVYNAEKDLAHCLASIVQQTYSDIEIVCVNDGSTDASSSILDAFQEADRRMLVHEQANRGLSAARNAGLEAASGQYVMFVDSDDWIDVRTCEVVRNIVLDSPADVVLWSYVREFPSGPKPKKIYPSQTTRLGEADFRDRIYRRIFGPVNGELQTPEHLDALVTAWGKLYRSELLHSSGATFVDTDEIGTAEDALFNVDALSAVKNAGYVDMPLYHYRKARATSFTHRYKPSLACQRERLFANMRDRLVEHRLGPEFTRALENRIALSIIGLGLNELNNPAGAGARIDNIDAILRSPTYRQALDQLETPRMPPHWRAFFLTARAGSSRGTYALLLAMRQRIGK